MKVSEAIKCLEALQSAQNQDPELIIMWWAGELFEYQADDGSVFQPSEQAVAYVDAMVNENDWINGQIREVIADAFARYDAEGWEE